MGSNDVQLSSLPYYTMEEENDIAQPEPMQVVMEPKHNHAHSHHGSINPLHRFKSMDREKRIALFVALGLTVLALFSIIWASVEKSKESQRQHMEACKAFPLKQRVDASLGIYNTKTECLRIGGCWDDFAEFPTPTCYHSELFPRGYKVKDKNISYSGMDILLHRDAHVKLFGSEKDTLKVIISYETDSRLRVKIFDPDEDRFQVPMREIHQSEGHRMQYVLSITEDLFGFSVSRTHDSTTNILNSTFDGFIFSDQFIQITMKLSSPYIQGLSDFNDVTLLRKMSHTRRTVWNNEHRGRHGGHPFLLSLEDGGHFSGILLLNSNAMDVILNPYPAVTYRTTGGILDFYIFLGPTAFDVIQQYSQQVGRTYLPPLWSLGYLYGSDEVGDQTVLESLLSTALPIDAVVLGVSLLSNKSELTVDKHAFPSVSDVVSKFAARNRFLLSENRPYVSKDNDNVAFVRGKKKDLFVKYGIGRSYLVSSTKYKENTVFPDYFNGNTKEWIKEQLHDFINVSGMVLLDNEPTTADNGSVEGCTGSSINLPAYKIGGSGDNLMENTLCPSAIHFNNVLHYNLHNLYGWKHSQVTQNVLNEGSTSRKLVLSRSTFIGSGQYTGYWVKNSNSSWLDFRKSIISILNYNIYGITLSGSNVCGYGINPDLELCLRWHQASIFFPITLRYSSKGIYGDNKSKQMDYIISAIYERYSLIPTLYTQFYKSHVQGFPVVTPLYFLYPNDNVALSLNTQFMFAESILVPPVTTKGAKELDVYFPNDVWFDYHNAGNKITPGWLKSNISLEKQNYYVRGGSVLVRYLNSSSFPTVLDMYTNGSFSVEVFLKHHMASGLLFLDDGVTQNTINEDKYMLVKFNATKNTLRTEVTLKYPGYKPSNVIKTVQIRGIEEVKSVLINEERWSNYNYQAGVLTVYNLQLPITEAFGVEFK